jgi:hypothetical protein
MSAKDKAKDLVDTYRIMLMNTDTECGEEILCTVIAKYSAIIAVDEMMSVLPFTDINTSLGRYCEKEKEYLEEVKQEIQLL